MKLQTLFNSLLSRMTPTLFRKMNVASWSLILSISLYFLSAFANTLFIQPTSAIAPSLKGVVTPYLPSLSTAMSTAQSLPALSIFLWASMALMVPAVLIIISYCLDITYLTKLSQTLLVARGTMASLVKALQAKALSITLVVTSISLAFLLVILLPLSSRVVQPTLVLPSLIALHLLLLFVKAAAIYGARFAIQLQAEQSLTNSLSPDITSEVSE